MSAEVSHGRGGAGNIRTDDTKYVDGVIVREGIAGSQGAGPFSTGRGGKEPPEDIPRLSLSFEAIPFMFSLLLPGCRQASSHSDASTWSYHVTQ